MCVEVRGHRGVLFLLSFVYNVKEGSKLVVHVDAQCLWYHC